MKNKGRKHLKHMASGGTNNCGGMIDFLTRPIRSMSSKGVAVGSFDKKKWTKRVRGYFKSQTKEIL